MAREKLCIARSQRAQHHARAVVERHLLTIAAIEESHQETSDRRPSKPRASGRFPRQRARKPSGRTTIPSGGARSSTNSVAVLQDHSGPARGKSWLGVILARSLRMQVHLDEWVAPEIAADPAPVPPRNIL